MDSPPTITVLVTGGSGFIGSYVILDLLAAGYTVRTTVRSLEKEKLVREMLATGGASPESLKKLTFFAADLANDAGWKETIHGSTFVQHVASPFPLFEPKHEDELIIPAREGTLRVLKAAKEAGVKRVILTSSVAAVSAGHPARATAFTEEDWSITDGSLPITAYAKSKTLAERAAWDFMSKEGGSMELSVINPVGVFGPVLGTDFSTSIQIVKKMMDGSVPGCPHLYVSVVDVRDVAALQILGMTSPKAAGERFIAVNDGKSYPMIDISKLLREKRPEVSKKVPTFQVPNFAVRILSWFDAPIKLILNDLDKDAKLSNEKAKSVLGWKPRSSEESILASADSLVAHKVL